jgi:hypothetical protein
MLFSMQWTRIAPRGPVALLAAVIMLVAVPLHAAHVHHEEAVTLHAPCAACQVQAPAGTPPDAGALIVEPDCFSHFVDVRTGILLHDAHGRIDACRAPPSLFA